MFNKIQNAKNADGSSMQDGLDRSHSHGGNLLLGHQFSGMGINNSKNINAYGSPYGFGGKGSSLSPANMNGTNGNIFSSQLRGFDTNLRTGAPVNLYKRDEEEKKGDPEVDVDIDIHNLVDV